MLLLSSVVLLGIDPAVQTYAQGQPSNQFPQSIVAFSNTDTTPHALELKFIQQGDSEPQEISGFSLDINNTVTAQINSQVIVFVTDSSVQVVDAKVGTQSGQLIELVPSIQANAFSLANLPAGIYTLDVITQKGNAKAAYEGILVLGQEPTNPQTQTIIERDGDDGDDGDDGGNCDPSYPDDCIPSPPPDLDCGDNGVQARKKPIKGGSGITEQFDISSKSVLIVF